MPVQVIFQVNSLKISHWADFTFSAIVRLGMVSFSVHAFPPALVGQLARTGLGEDNVDREGSGRAKLPGLSLTSQFAA